MTGHQAEPRCTGIHWKHDDAIAITVDAGVGWHLAVPPEPLSASVQRQLSQHRLMFLGQRRCFTPTTPCTAKRVPDLELRCKSRYGLDHRAPLLRATQRVRIVQTARLHYVRQCNAAAAAVAAHTVDEDRATARASDGDE